MRKSNEQSLGEVIRQCLKAFHIEDKISEVKIYGAWEKVMGKNIQCFTEKLVYRNKVLAVYLRSAPLREELSMAKTKIIASLNKELGQNLITELVLR